MNQITNVKFNLLVAAKKVVLKKQSSLSSVIMKFIGCFLVAALFCQLVHSLPLQKKKADVLLNAVRDVYNHIDNALSNVETKLALLQGKQQSLSTKVGSLQSGLNALTGRINSRSTVCYDKVTNWQPRSDAAIMFLDRHHLSCPRGQFLESFRLGRQADRLDAKVRYFYKCCKLVI